MPISPIVLQRRHAELGRIRLGDKRETSSGKQRPNKLDRFRFTSVSERYIRDLATLYGGEAKPWDNNGIPSWEVYTDAQSVPVIVVKGGLSQWMETWSGGGCVHRCDGHHNVLTDSPCNPEDPQHINAKPTTRLSLMLVDLEAIGVWRCETHGWNAAAEIPAVAELAQFVGDLVPANLHLVERRSVKDGQTSRFVVPVLDLQIGTERLKEIVAQKSGQAAPAELGGGGPAAIEAPRPDYLAEAKDAKDLDAWREVWNAAKAAGHLTPELKDELTRIGQSLNPGAQQPTVQPEPNPDGSYDAEVVEDDAVAIWERIVKEGAARGLATLSVLQDDFSAVMQGMIPSEATAGELQVYLDKLLAADGEQVPA